MLTVEVVFEESYDNKNQIFVATDKFDLQLEHSLVSLSKWESITKIPFLNGKAKNAEETLLYIKCMVLSPEVPEKVFEHLTLANYNEISEYITSKQTATWVNEPATKRTSRETITAELIYYWMVALGVPQEYQHWHLDKLLTLIRVINFKSSPPKKMSRAELAARNRELNAKRKAELGTRG